MPDLSNADEAWYCFQALTKREHIAAELIRAELQLPVFCPRISYNKATRRGKVRFVEPLFPGYLFLKGDLREHFRRISAVQGVRRLVSYGDRVPKVPESFIAELKSRIGDTEVREVESPVVKAGARVKIVSGPFLNWDAVVEGVVPARDRVKLLLDFLGRQLRVEVSAFDIHAESSDVPTHKVWK